MDNNTIQDTNDVINEKMKSFFELVGYDLTIDDEVTSILHGKVIDDQMFYLVGIKSNTRFYELDICKAFVTRGGKVNFWEYDEDDKLEKFKIIRDEHIEKRQQEKKEKATQR
jgi:hypothetical protein